jgi:hypothetical protein
VVGEPPATETRATWLSLTLAGSWNFVWKTDSTLAWSCDECGVGGPLGRSVGRRCLVRFALARRRRCCTGCCRTNVVRAIAFRSHLRMFLGVKYCSLGNVHGQRLVAAYSRTANNKPLIGWAVGCVVIL